MKRPTANVSGDNPGDSAPVAGEERNQTLFHLGVAPPHVFSPDWFLQYGYLGNAPLLAITDVFHLAGGTGTLYPPRIPFRCSVKCASNRYLPIRKHCGYIKA